MFLGGKPTILWVLNGFLTPDGPDSVAALGPWDSHRHGATIPPIDMELANLSMIIVLVGGVEHFLFSKNWNNHPN